MQVPTRRSEKKPLTPIDYHLSPEKYRELEKKLIRLKARHPQEAIEVKRLAEMGDFSENAGYQLAKSRLRGLNQRILDLENLLKRAEIVVVDTDTSTVKIGHRITVNIDDKEKTYTILGASESDPASGVISHNSPLGAGLLGHQIGDAVTIKINDKERTYRIIKIEA